MNRTKVMNKKMADNRIYTVARQNGNKYFLQTFHPELPLHISVTALRSAAKQVST